MAQEIPEKLLLQLKDLVVEIPTRRGTLTPVNGVSMDIKPGEILGVVGESGAGKSITGTAVTGLLEKPARIAGGSVILDGEEISKLDQGALRKIRGKEVGAIFQDPLTSLNPLMTVGEQLAETALAHLKISRNEARARALQALIDVGIPAAENRIDGYPHEFSGGMRQRVVIALALIGEPKLVIADEPTTALDVSVQAQILALLRKLCNERHTGVMLITHDMGVIAETTDRVAVMYAGRVVEIGRTRDVLTQPRHPYTIGLMSATPTTAVSTGAPQRLNQIPGAMPGLMSIPDGCPFHPRCDHSMDRCATSVPPLIADAVGSVACYLVENAKHV